MNKIISILTLFSALMLPLAHASFEDDADCSVNSYQLGGIPNLFANNCKLVNGDEAKYCNCLKTSNNILLKAVSEQQAEQLKKDQEKLRATYSKKLMKVLFQINTGVHLQQQSFGIKKPDGQTDCTPKKFAKEFTNSICRTVNKDGNSCQDNGTPPPGSDYSGSTNNLDDCKKNNNCDVLYDEIKLAWERNQSKNNKPSQVTLEQQGEEVATKAANNFCSGVSCALPTASVATTDRVIVPGVNLTPYNWVPSTSTQPTPTIPEGHNAETEPTKDPTTDSGSFLGIWGGKKIPEECLLSSEKKTLIGDMINFFHKYPKIVDPVLLENIKKIKSEDQICGNEDLFNKSVKEYKFKVAYTPVGANIAAEIPSEVELKIQNELEKQNKRGEKILKKGFEESKLPNACVSYDKYKVLSSVPDGKLISQWASLTDAQIASSLDPKSLATSSSPSLQFIRNNPMLAKMVIDGNTRGVLAKKLKAFADGNQSKDKGGQLSSFIEFMKNDVSKISTGMVDLYQCDLLARNAAAVHSSNLFPANVPLGNSDAFGLQANLYACAMKDQVNDNKFPVLHLDKILESNALLDLLGSPSDSSVIYPDGDENYRKYLDENCKGYQGFRNDFIAKYCGMLLMGSKCVEKFNKLSRSRLKRLKKKYYEKLNPEMGQLTTIVDDNTGNVDFDDLSEASSDENQNLDLSQEYEEKIKPNTYSSIFDFSETHAKRVSGTFEDVAKAQAEYDKRVANSSTGRGTSLSDLSNNDTNSKSGKSLEGDSITNIRKSINSPENSTNSGQVVPNYLSNTQSQNAAPLMESRNITSLKQANDFVDRVTGKEGSSFKPENKEEVVKNVQKYIDGTKDNSSEMAKLQDKILDLEDQISEDRKNKTNGRSTASVGGGDSPQVTPSPMNQMNQNFSGAIPFAPGFSPALAAGGKIQRAQAASAASYQKALNDKYIQSEKDSTPYNRSSDQFVLNKEPYVGAGGEELLVGLELSPTTKEFSKIVDSEANLLKYLNENLIKIPGSKIISIKCGPQCDDKANDLLLHVERDQFNKIVIRSVASSTPVVRVHKLDILNKEFKGIK